MCESFLIEDVCPTCDSLAYFEKESDVQYGPSVFHTIDGSCTNKSCRNYESSFLNKIKVKKV